MDKFDNFIRFGDQAINLNWVVRFVVTDNENKVTAILKDAEPEGGYPFVEGAEAERLLEALQWNDNAASSISDFGGAGHASAVRGNLSVLTVDAGAPDEPSE